MDYSNIYSQVEKSIVRVIVGIVKNNELQPAFHGTGTIVDDGTKVLICSHRIDTNSQTYVVVDTLVLPAKTVYEDKKNDIAILELIGYVGTPLPIKKNHGLLIGNEIFTIGFPYDAYSEKTLTIGHLAAFEGDVLKINCAVNNGNSGGPLLNMNGEVAGAIIVGTIVEDVITYGAGVADDAASVGVAASSYNAIVSTAVFAFI